MTTSSKNDTLTKLQETKQSIADWTQEYVALKGFVTCEFSTSESRLNLIKGDLASAFRYLEPLESFWISYPCSTCAKHSDGEAPIHVTIVNKRYYEKLFADIKEIIKYA